MIYTITEILILFLVNRFLYPTINQNSTAYPFILSLPFFIPIKLFHNSINSIPIVKNSNLMFKFHKFKFHIK